MAKAGKKRQQKTAPAHNNKKPKRVPEDDDGTQFDHEVCEQRAGSLLLCFLLLMERSLTDPG